MNELIMPHNVGVKNALENMKEVLALGMSRTWYLTQLSSSCQLVSWGEVL